MIPKDFVEIQRQYLSDIMAVVLIEEFPHQLIINWDDTAMKVVPATSWTMERKGTNCVEISGIDEKRHQIMALFACMMAGHFLPIQLIYGGTTPKCLPKVTFPSDWHITYTPNHWSNEATMKAYYNTICDREEKGACPEEQPHSSSYF